jgi:hypothetical protein
MYFNMGYAALAPDLWEFLGLAFSEVRKSPKRPFDPDAFPAIRNAQDRLIRTVWGEEFKLTLRKMYIVSSALAVFALYLAIRGWGRGKLEPLVGAALLALSWEVNYHARHIAVDNLMMLFGTLVLAAAIRYAKEESPSRALRWLALGSVAAGLAGGSKIIGLSLIIPLVAVALLFRKEPLGPGVLFRVVLVPLLALAALFVVTPGLFLDPVRAVNSWAIVLSDYSARFGEDYTYYARPYGGQIPLIFLYLVSSAFSPYQWLSIILSVFALVGLFSIFREDRKFFLVFLSFPLAYLIVCSGMKLMIVRNFLVLFPFMAMAVARGVRVAFHGLSEIRSARYVLAGFLLCWIALNTLWLFRAASTVRLYTTRETVEELADYVQDQGDDRYFFSPLIRYHLKTAGLPDVVSGYAAGPESTGDTFCVLFLSEYPLERWRANRKGFFERVIGSHEVNYDYYPTWAGHNYESRVYVISPERARVVGYPCRALR